MMKRFWGAAALLWCGLASSVWAADEAASANIRQALMGLVPDMQIDSIEKSVLPGMYEVTIGPEVYYVSEDGRYMVMGKVMDLHTREDISETKLSKARLNVLAQFGDKDRITFAPPNPKHEITVFTDIDCGYCRKLHSEIEQYNAKGIAVHYLFYPRAGVGSPSYKEAVSVWCAADRKSAFTAAKAGQPPEEKQCEHPVMRHMEAARALGLEGTPMIILDDGRRMGGYLPADELAQRFENKGKKKAGPQANKMMK
jgi:thiol:disulfide interchange protein DsbC